MRYFRKSSLIVISLNLLSLGVLGFLGRQLYNDASRVVAAYQELYTAARGKENLAVITKSFTATVEPRAVIANAFLHTDGLVIFIEQLEGLAKTASVTLELDEPKSITGKTASLDLAFRATGSFAGLYRFLSLLESLPYRLDWRSVTWNFASGTTWSGDFALAVISYTDANTNATP